MSEVRIYKEDNFIVINVEDEKEKTKISLTEEQTLKIKEGLEYLLKEKQNTVSNIVYIETNMSSIILENIRPEDITKEAFDNGDLFINFGDKASIKSDSFISYEICDSKNKGEWVLWKIQKTY